MPHVRASVRGLKMKWFECFSWPRLDLLVDIVNAIVGSPGRPSSSTHVRWGERGAPVQFLMGSAGQQTVRTQR
jgi:hypothetical protein